MRHVLSHVKRSDGVHKYWKRLRLNMHGVKKEIARFDITCFIAVVKVVSGYFWVRSWGGRGWRSYRIPGSKCTLWELIGTNIYGEVKLWPTHRHPFSHILKHLRGKVLCCHPLWSNTYSFLKTVSERGYVHYLHQNQLQKNIPNGSQINPLAPG